MSKWIDSVHGTITRQPLWLRAMILAILLGILALMLRIPNFMTIPPLTDEFKEVGWALDMIETGKLPLVSVDSYDGPFFPYLLVLLIRIFGTPVFLPRMVVLVCGALTTIATFYFGKTLARGDWRVGAAAALLLASNAHHILFNSHVAWSSDITPLFTTLAMLAYIYATRRNRPRWLIPAGFLYGVALQTHPSVLALAPAFLIDFFVRRESRAGLRTVWPYLGVLGFLIAYSPLVIFNLQTNFDSLRVASRGNDALSTAPSVPGTLSWLVPQLYAISRVAFGTFGADTPQAPSWHLIWITFTVVTAVGCVWMARRGEIFPLVMSVCALLFLATFNRFVSIPDSARYFQFLLPVVFTAWSQTGFYLWDALRTRGRAWGRASGVVLALVLVFLCLFSLWQLEEYYAVARSSGRNNITTLQIIETLRQAPDAPVLLEYELNKIRTGRGGDLAGNLIYLMRLERRKPTLVSVTTPDALGGLQNFLRGRTGVFLIGFADTPERLGEDFPLQLLIQTRFPCPSCPVSDEFALYWWQEP